MSRFSWLGLRSLTFLTRNRPQPQRKRTHDVKTAEAFSAGDACTAPVLTADSVGRDKKRPQGRETQANQGGGNACRKPQRARNKTKTKTTVNSRAKRLRVSILNIRFSSMSTFLDRETEASVAAAIKWILISSSLCKEEDYADKDGDDDNNNHDLSKMLAMACQKIMDSTANMVGCTADMTVEAAESVANTLAHVAFVYSSSSVKDIHQAAAAATKLQKCSSSSKSMSKKVHWTPTQVQAW